MQPRNLMMPPIMGIPPEFNDFLFFELQNVLPSPVTLGSGLTSGETAAKTVWRVVRKDRAAATDPIQSVHEGATITPPATFLAFGTDAAGRNQIDGGGRFSVSATNTLGRAGFPLTSSDLFVDAGAYDAMSNTYTGKLRQHIRTHRTKQYHGHIASCGNSDDRCQLCTALRSGPDCSCSYKWILSRRHAIPEQRCGLSGTPPS